MNNIMSNKSMPRGHFFLTFSFSLSCLFSYASLSFFILYYFIITIIIFIFFIDLIFLILFTFIIFIIFIILFLFF